MHSVCSAAPEVARALGNVGAVHVCLGNHARAKELFERALPILETVPAPGGENGYKKNIETTKDILKSSAHVLFSGAHPYESLGQL